MVLPRAPALRSSLRALRATRVTARAPTQFARRTYASGSHEVKKSSDLPWLLGSVGLGVPAAFYLLQAGPEKKPHGHHDEEHHGDDHATEAGEAEQEKEAESSAAEAEPQPDKDAEKSVSSEEKEPGSEEKAEDKKEEGASKEDAAPSDVDQPDSRKETGGPNSTSAKQEGLSNSTTDHPSVNEPGKSVKGEGETETAKVKGAVSPERPQA